MPVMKKLFLFLCLGIFTACNNEETSDGLGTDAVSISESASGRNADNLPDIRFDEDTHDFGRITQGEKVSHSFFFTNTGKSNLIISGASGSCGCTVPEWPKDPIKPGDKGKIDVVFNSEGKSGYQEKTITVVTNCEPATKVIRIKTEIIVAEVAR